MGILILGSFLITSLFWGLAARIFSLSFENRGSFEFLLFLIGASLFVFTVSLAWNGICSLLIQNKWLLIISFFIAQAGYLFFFGRYLFGWILYFILVFTFWLWSFRARRDFATRTRVLSLRSMNFGLKTTITLFLVVISFSFYLQTENRLTDTQLIENLRDFSVEVIERVFSSRLEEFRPEMSFENLVLKNAKEGLLGNYLAGGADPSQLNRVTIDTLRKEYEEKYEINFKSSDSINAILTKIVGSRIERYFNRYSKYIPYALVAVIFLGLKLFTLVYFWLVRLGAFILFKLFLATGFVKITKEEVEVEILKI